MRRGCDSPAAWSLAAGASLRYNSPMKTLIIALNSRYIHSALAPWSLKACCGPECGEVGVAEHTINDEPGAVLSQIYREKPNVAAFSCYLWNIRFVWQLLPELKKVLPELKIILGGPEVSFDSQEIMDARPEVDYVVAGEGEQAFSKLLAALNGKGTSGPEDIDGLCFRHPGGTSFNAAVPVEEPAVLPSPYTPEMLRATGNRIVYYESSRGCPFSCSYCLSSTFSGVRYFPMDRVKRELSLLFDSGLRQVKFTDRTFNCSKPRAMEIFSHIAGLCDRRRALGGGEPDVNFHFEAAADLFDDEMLDLLARVPPGLIQLEIGLQTMNEKALDAVSRKTDLARLCDNVRRLRAAGNIHLHLDLIAGLPFEDFASFRESFDAVYGLRPHQLQLGFLKLLKGTRIRREAALHGYGFSSSPPYEMLFNKYLGFDELLALKGVEELLDRYFNSGRFSYTLEFLLKHLGPAFDFFLAFHRFNLARGLNRLPAGLKELYGLLAEFAASTGAVDADALKEFLRLDYLGTDGSGSLPQGLYRPAASDFRDKCFSFLRREGNVRNCIPALAGLPAKEIYKKVHFDLFSLDFSSGAARYDENARTVLLFDYTSKDRVTGAYRFLQPADFQL